MAHRARTVILLEGVKERSLTVTVQKVETGQKAETAKSEESGHSDAGAKETDHHGVLGSAAESIGSVLGSFAAKVKQVSSTTSTT